MTHSAKRSRWSLLAMAVVALTTAGCGWAEWPGTQPGSQGWQSASPPPRGAESRTVPFSERPGRVTIMRGDSVARLSQRYGAPSRSIIELNNLKPPYRLYVGQVLALPRDREHVVRSGETLSELAERNRMSMGVLASANGLSQPYRLFQGQRLRIPEVPVTAAPDTELAARSSVVPLSNTSAESPPLSAAQQPPARPQTSSSPPPVTAGPVISPERKPTAPVTTAAVAPKPSAVIGKPPPKTGGGFLWPVSGKVISRFGSKGSGLRNDGINIAASRGEPVRAAETGVVAYAGNELKAFGKLVLIKHAGGWVTTYAHNDAITVARGDLVHKGQIIAKAGSSGSVSSPQLHFEMRKGKKAVDPLRYLPPGRV